MKKITMTEKEWNAMRTEWYERGAQQARKELGEELAEKLGLYEIFETRSC